MCVSCWVVSLETAHISVLMLLCGLGGFSMSLVLMTKNSYYIITNYTLHHKLTAAGCHNRLYSTYSYSTPIWTWLDTSCRIPDIKKVKLPHEHDRVRLSLFVNAIVICRSSAIHTQCLTCMLHTAIQYWFSISILSSTGKWEGGTFLYHSSSYAGCKIHCPCWSITVLY